MELNQTTLIGVAASIFTATSLLPQLIKIAKEKKADDISYGMLVVLFIGLALWIYYGILKEDWIIIGCNSLSVIINICTAVMSFKYKTNK